MSEEKDLTVSPIMKETAAHHRLELASEIGASLASALGQHVVTKLRKDELYRVVLSRPVGSGLNPRADGLYDAFVKGPDGTMLSVARLKSIKPEIMPSIGMLAGQAMLVQISSQIAELQADMETLLRLQIGAELGKVQSAISRIRTIQHYGQHREQVLLSTIATLKDAIGVATRYAATLITTVPEPPRWNIVRAVWDTSNDTVKALSRARDAVLVVLLGLQTLGEAEVLLNENLAAAEIMVSWMEGAQRDLDLKRCERLARMMPANGDADRHELFWMKAATFLSASQKRIRDLVSGEAPLSITFECNANDLVGRMEITDTSDTV